MTTWVLLAPGPSASSEQARQVHAAGLRLGAIGNAYQLAPRANFIAATDGKWWRTFPEAKERDCPKYAMHGISGVKIVKMPTMGIVNSGVLGLEVAVKHHGATRILLLGYDQRGSHFFGQYTNGLRNTAPHQRKQHLRQFAAWQHANRKIEVYNCTKGSALTCFPEARLEDFIETSVPESPAHEVGSRGDVRAGAAA